MQGMEDEEFSLEGNPFIIRFKIPQASFSSAGNSSSLEGNPFIIRFKIQLQAVCITYLP